MINTAATFPQSRMVNSIRFYDCQQIWRFWRDKTLLLIINLISNLRQHKFCHMSSPKDCFFFRKISYRNRLQWNIIRYGRMWRACMWAIHSLNFNIFSNSEEFMVVVSILISLYYFPQRGIWLSKLLLTFLNSTNFNELFLEQILNKYWSYRTSNRIFPIASARFHCLLFFF